MDHPNHLQQARPQDGLISMVKDIDGPTLLPDGPRIKYDPVFQLIIL